MRIVLAEEMRNLDQRAGTQYGLPGLLLMENAGHAVAEAACSMLGGCRDKKIVILAGKGSNGGDGSGAGRWLVNGGARVCLVLTGRPEDLTGSAAEELQYYLSAGGSFLAWNQEDTGQIETVKRAIAGADLVIDALLGTGFAGELRPAFRTLCQAVNAADARVLAVDIPTGVNADDGRCDRDAVRADVTVTMALPKQGLYLYPGVIHAGEVRTADIGMPKPMLSEEEGDRFVITEELVRDLLPLRPKNMHKGAAGRVTLAAGSEGYVGAAALSGFAAVKGGAGLVTLLTPAGARPLLAVKLTEVMVKSLPQTGTGGLSPDAADLLIDESKDGDVLAIGPGLGTSEETQTVVRQALLETQLPCVIDADALTALQGHADLLLHMAAEKVLTPHPGEMARLTGLTVAQVEKDRVETAKAFARQWQCVLVLKGVPTVVADPDGTVYLNPTGNPAMATGGCGDVLTGLLAALMAQGMPAIDAAVSAVYLHGLAGDLAAGGSVGLAASELSAKLPEARKLVQGDLRTVL